MLNGLSAAASGLIVVLAFVIVQSGSHGVSQQDRSFAFKAEQANNAEIAEGRLAHTRGTASTVRALGSRMVRDHTSAAAALDAVARGEHLAVASSLGGANAQQLQRLRSLHGQAFDDAYVGENIPEHRQAIAVLQHEIAGGSDPALRAWARRTLPALQMHLSLFEHARRAGR